MESQYTIVGRFMNGVKVEGYYLLDEYGRGNAVSKSEVEQLALNKQILNCTAQKYKGSIVIKGTTCKLSSLPVVNVSQSGQLTADIVPKKQQPGSFVIVGRILDKKFIRGYMLRDEANVVRRIAREQVIELARVGRVTNARVQLNNGEAILRGVNCDLSSLPGYKINEKSM